ncbi:FabD/lysophospholipase-like protein [Acephala macrosclerotiorum]|nr:FabD/lysophospholipase-like protein [Acephala macrosclerotiorum]
MKRCDHSHWLSLGVHGNGAALLESDRLQTLTHHIRDPNTQQPSLLVFIGSTSKSQALREIFGVKKAPKFRSKRTAGEIHLHLDPRTIFHSRPMLIADGDLPDKNLREKAPKAENCHDMRRRPLLRSTTELTNTIQNENSDSIYSRLLLPFADVFCFFSNDVGGFKKIACHIAVWLEKAQPSTLLRYARPRVVIVTEKMPPGAEREEEARKAFLWLLREETARDLFEQISNIHVVALLPDHKVSSEARYRRLKECLLYRSDDVRRNREDARTLFSATHFAALFRDACDHFSQTIKEPFDFIKASRKQNPVAKDLAKHLSIFLNHIKSANELIEFAAPIIASSILIDNYPPESHSFEPEDVFQTLYKDVFSQVSNHRVITFDGSPDIILRSGFVKRVENRLRVFWEQSICQGTPSSDLHRRTLRSFEDRWRNIQSSSTCLSCLRRRPQYGLPCGHIVCENCVLVFGESYANDPWTFNVPCCLLCGAESREVVVKVHPPTAGAGILCIDGGGTRGVLPLKSLKRIQDRIGLPMPPQRFFKVIVGTSSGGLDAAGLFVEGWTVEESLQNFERLAKVAFTGWRDLGIPFISWLLSFFYDGLYPAAHIEAAVKEAFGDKRILDNSYATSIGARVAFLVATVREPSCYLFTNYNGVGARDDDQGRRLIRPEDGYGNVRLWEIARAASAAPGFFPPKEIDGVGIFQDAGPLENDPLISALELAADMCPLVEEPDFIVSLGTGTPRTKESSSVPASSHLRLWKDKAFPRLWRMFWEKMRDRQVKQVFRTYPRYHRLDTEFDGPLPRLDNIQSIHELQLKAQEDPSVSKVIDNIARYAIASLFYFELDSKPEKSNGDYTGIGSIFCTIRQSDPAFQPLLDQLSNATFYLNNCPIPGTVDDHSFIGKDGNFRKRVELSLSGRFTISLKQGDSEPCNISGSPYSVERQILALELDAHFGRADHGKRKRSADGDLPARKRQRI